MAEEHRFRPYTGGNIPNWKFQHVPPVERVKNQFANDGSFLEMFKKQMEEDMKKAEADDLSNNKNNSTTTTAGEMTSNNDNNKIMLSSSSSDDTLTNINNTKTTTTSTSTATTTTNPLKSGLLPLVGKRRSDLRRSLKTGIVKKLRSDPSDTDDQSSMNASSQYTQEVKRYKATMCVEDEKSRPLVK